MMNRLVLTCLVILSFSFTEEKDIIGKYTGILPRRLTHEGKRVTSKYSSVIYLTLSKNHRCKYEGQLKTMKGRWSLTGDSVVSCIYAKEKDTLTFKIKTNGCLQLVNSRTDFCK